jgi:hypothetical protein
MAGSQIPTAVTILNSLKGFQSVSLTEYNTSAAASIAAGSVVEIAGAFFTFVSDEAINASSWTAIVTGTTAYITLTPSGTSGSQIVNVAYTSTAPTWRDDHQGWYASAASNVRVIGSVYKAEAANYQKKVLLFGITNTNWTQALNGSMGDGWPSQLQTSFTNLSSVVIPQNIAGATTGSYIIPGCIDNNQVNSSGSSTTYTKLMEIKCPATGTYTVNFYAGNATAGIVSARARIYINGSAVGTERTTSSTSKTLYTQNLSIVQGDLVQLYGRYVTAEVSVEKFGICSSGYGVLYQ